MNTATQSGLFLVDSANFPLLDTQALANEIVARVEREFALTSRVHLAQPPVSFFETPRDTPVTVLRRVLRNVVPSLLSLAPLIFRP